MKQFLVAFHSFSLSCGNSFMDLSERHSQHSFSLSLSHRSHLLPLVPPFPSYPHQCVPVPLGRPPAVPGVPPSLFPGGRQLQPVHSGGRALLHPVHHAPGLPAGPGAPGGRPAQVTPLPLFWGCVAGGLPSGLGSMLFVVLRQ